ncbi:hypothetical protein ElyMa_004692900 [Elysia marginata]|uniref:Ubiquinol-cytochrome-c reductase complex assembly factor 3 n=1 Tax=Elysia marginata TaxID=1093978 RepID=A0AAV4I6A6_9GAST|nr:hypothetical protein ElyMa_004692900 [Elysia marginata]
MVVLKEIKRKDFLKGTKAARLLYYVGAGMIGFTALLGIPLYRSAMAGKPEALERRRLAEEERKKKSQQFFQLQSLLYEKQETAENKNKTLK